MTILNAYVEKVKVSSSKAFLLWFFILLSTIFVTCCIAAYKENSIRVGTTMLVLFIVSIVITMAASFDICFRPEVQTYEVTLSDDYPVTKLLGNYKIIEQRGEIWVIQEKEDQNGKE